MYDKSKLEKKNQKLQQSPLSMKHTKIRFHSLMSILFDVGRKSKLEADNDALSPCNC